MKSVTYRVFGRDFLAKLISIAVLAGASGTAPVLMKDAVAQTSVQLGGTIDVYAGLVNYSGDTAGKATMNSSGLETSWWGFKGTEDLGNGLKAHFALTGFFRPNDGSAGRFDSDTMFSRDANVGLSGSFGRFSLGRDVAPNFIPTLKFSPFGGSFAFAPLELQTQTSTGRYRGQQWSPTVAGDTGWSNEIMYVTPELGGLTTSLFLQLGNVTSGAGKNNLGINTLYERGPLSFTGYFQSVKSNNPVDTVTTGDSTVFSFTPYNKLTGATYTLNASKNDTWFIGGSYDFSSVKLFGTLNYSTNRLIGTADDSQFSLKSNTVQLGASAPIGRGSVLFSWARTNVKAKGDFSAQLGNSDVVTSVTRNTASLGYDYFLSRRTDLYGVVSYDKLTGQGSAVGFGLGMRQRF